MIPNRIQATDRIVSDTFHRLVYFFYFAHSFILCIIIMVCAINCHNKSTFTVITDGFSVKGNFFFFFF